MGGESAEGAVNRCHHRATEVTRSSSCPLRLCEFREVRIRTYLPPGSAFSQPSSSSCSSGSESPATDRPSASAAVSMWIPSSRRNASSTSRNGDGGCSGARRRHVQLRLQLVEDVVRVVNEFHAVLNEPMRPLGTGREDRAGNGEDLAVLLRGRARRDQRSAAAGRLHDHRPERDAADDAIADGEVVAEAAACRAGTR